MTAEECRRILGVPANSGPEAIRQAYLDLARVWHPDRFQSDERLRRIAEQHFQQISNAYTTLKSGRPDRVAPDSPRGRATATEDPPSPPPRPASPPPPRPRQSKPYVPLIFRRWQPFGIAWFRKQPTLRPVLVAGLIAAPFLAARMLLMLTAPVFDSDLVAAHSIRPRILQPMRSIDASSDVRVAADALTEWARGDAVDLWKPAGAEAPQARVTTAAAPRKHVESKLPDAPPAPPPANGADLLEPLRGGAGELHLSNKSDLEAVVKLVSRNRSIARAVYVAPQSSATVHSVGIGVYELDVDLGHDLDAEHLHFRSNRFTPTPLGPFQFAEITSDTGVSGNRYDVVLNSR